MAIASSRIEQSMLDAGASEKSLGHIKIKASTPWKPRKTKRIGPQYFKLKHAFQIPKQLQS
jgi:hypothetical protein